MRIIIIDKRLLSFWRGYGRILRCEICNKELKVNEIVVSRTSGAKRKYYHWECYEGMFRDEE